MRKPSLFGPALRRNWLLILLLALPLGSSALVIGAARQLAAPPAPTGDAFVDELLQAASYPAPDLLTAPWIASQYLVVTSSAFLSNGFKRIDPSFSHDPRYTELEYAAMRITLGQEREDSYARLPAILEQLARQSDPDALRYYRFATEYDRRRGDPIAREIRDQRPGSSTAGTQLSWDETLRQRALMDSAHRAETDALVNSVIALDPGLAWGHYFAASISTERGDFAAAFEQLSTGNRLAAPPLLPVPRNIAFELPDAAVSAPASKLAAGTLSRTLLTGPSGWHGLLDAEGLEQLVQHCVERKERAGLDVLLRYLCRSALAANDSPSRHRDSAESLLALIAAAEQGLSLSTAQAQALDRLKDVAKRLEKESASLRSSQQALVNRTTKAGARPWTVRKLAGPLLDTAADLETDADRLLMRRDRIATDFFPLWEEASGFSFETMSWDDHGSTASP